MENKQETVTLFSKIEIKNIDPTIEKLSRLKELLTEIKSLTETVEPLSLKIIKDKDKEI